MFSILGYAKKKLMWKLWGLHDQWHTQEGLVKWNIVIKGNIQSKEILINSEKKNDSKNRLKQKRDKKENSEVWNLKCNVECV
jgi:hypothetical protein